MLPLNMYLNVHICTISEKDIKYLHKITIHVLTHMMRMVDFVTICVETLRWSIECSLENFFIKLIFINPCIILYLTCN